MVYRHTVNKYNFLFIGHFYCGNTDGNNKRVRKITLASFNEILPDYLSETSIPAWEKVTGKKTLAFKSIQDFTPKRLVNLFPVDNTTQTSPFQRHDNEPRETDIRTKESILDSLLANINTDKQESIQRDTRSFENPRVVDKLTALYQDESFITMEKNWRDLLFFLQNTAAMPEIDSYIYSTESSIESWKDYAENNLYDILEEFTPTAIILCYSCQPNSAFVESLSKITKVCADATIPVLVNIDEDFFPGSMPVSSNQLDRLSGFYDLPEFQKWRAFREKDHTRWLCVVGNGYLLRDAYYLPVQDSSMETQPCSPPLWGHPATLLACTIARSLHKTGWPTYLTENCNMTMEEMNLPDFDFCHDEGQHRCLQFLPKEEMIDLLMDCGICLTNSRLHIDKAWFRHIPMFHGMSCKKGSGTARLSLDYQLFTAIINREIVNLLTEAQAENPHDKLLIVQNRLMDLIEHSSPGGSITVSTDEQVFENSNNYLVTIRSNLFCNTKLPPLELKLSL